MTNRKYSTFPPGATLLAVLMIGATATVMAQTPPQGKMTPHRQGMEGMLGMRGMMNGPHQLLAMAYRDNLATFARALRGQVTQSKTVNVDFARPATVEMRRSFDQMREHHQAQMKVMAVSADSSMSAMSKHMETHLSALNEHLTALESEVNGSTPDAAKVSEHATEILKECAGMSAMPGKAKPHQMK